MVDLILDTNVWISHIAKDKPDGIFEEFKKQIEKGQIILLINDIILDEWKRNKNNTLRDISNEIKITSKNALKIKTFLNIEEKEKIESLLNKYSSIETEQIKLAEKRIEEIERLMADATKVEIKDEMKIQVANWALEKRAPFVKKANSVGDALILLSMVTHRNEDTSIYFRPGFFVSLNHSDYSKTDKHDEIHEDLKEMLEDANLTYKRNIGEVLNLTPEINANIESYIDNQIEWYMEQQAEIRRGK